MGEILDLHAQIQLKSGCMTMRRPVNLVKVGRPRKH